MGKFLGDGYRSKALLTEDGYVILKGRSEEAYESYKRDAEVLNSLKDCIRSTKIPSDAVLIERCEEFPFGGLKYRLIEGKVVRRGSDVPSAVAGSLGVFLTELHLAEQKFSAEEIVRGEKAFVERNISLLAEKVEAETLAGIHRWQQEYYVKLEHYDSFARLHGDFWYENYILSEDGSRLNGVVDFENSCIFIREHDFAPLMYIGEEFMQRVIESYHLDVDRRLIELMLIRREVCSFENIISYDPKDAETQIGKIVVAIKRFG